MTSRIRWTWAVALACLVASASCRGEEAGAGESSGAPVEITAPADTLVTTESGLLVAVSDMRVAMDGRLYIADERARDVKVLDAQGTHLQTIGGQGVGPGKFVRPVSLAIRADSLLVLDPGNGRLQVFSLDGDVLSTQSVSGRYNPVVGPDGGIAHATLGVDSVLAIMFSPEGEERARIGEVLAPPTNRVNMQELRREIEAGEVPGIFLNTAVPVIDQDEAAWLILPSAGRVDRFDREGQPLFSVTLSEPGQRTEIDGGRDGSASLGVSLLEESTVNDDGRDQPTEGPAVDGIVLAAGQSRRMGRSKALLGVGGRTFIERAVGVLRDGGCRDVVAVVRAGAEREAELAQAAGGRVVVNAKPDTEQIDSLRIGLADLRHGATGAAVLPVDHPLVSQATVAALVGAFRARQASVVRPVHGDSGGHPTVFSRALFGELLSDDLAEGARSVIEAHAGEIEDVRVADAGVVADIDTPEEYTREVRE